MNKKKTNENVQSLIELIKLAKKEIREKQDFEKNTPKIKYELITTYILGNVKNELTLELSSISKMSLWKESETFLNDLFKDKDYHFVSAEIIEWGIPIYKSDNYFFIWRKT